MKLPVFNKEGKKVQEIDVPEVFSELKKNDALVHQAVRAQQLNNYFPWAHTKDRGDVSGGGKKPWRQKGTGRARHGSIRSPIWKGGGVTFGPTNEKIRKVDLNKNMRRKAILTVIAGKIKDDQIRVIDALQFTNPKTKDIDAFLKYFVKPTKTTKFETVLLALPENDTAIIRATRNLKYADAMEARNLNILELLNATPENLIFRTDIYDHALVKPWMDGLVILVGDAAHPVLPSGFWGASLALEDAVCLAQELGTSEVSIALQHFQKKTHLMLFYSQVQKALVKLQLQELLLK